MEDRILKFVMALRSSGVRISLAESADAFRAIDELGVKDREQFRLSLLATLIKDATNLPVFDKLFPLFFGSATAPPLSNLQEELTGEEAQRLAEALRQFNDLIRQMMERVMRGESLSEEELEQLGNKVGLEGVSDLRYQEWMARRMAQALQFREVQEALEELMALLAEMGMDPERIDQMRQLLQGNQEALLEQLRQYAGGRIADQLSENPPDDNLESLMQRPFSSLSERDMQRLRKVVRRLANVLRTRVALRQKRAKSGQLDAKATIRANLKHGNVPVVIKHRDRRLKPKVVVVCDLSTSMRHMSELMLSLLYAIQDQISKTHAFAFIDHLEFITPYFERHDSSIAITKVLEKMPSGYYNTDLGYSLQNFNRDYMDLIDRRVTFILVGDGRNNFNNPRLDIFQLIARRSNKAIWINPEPRNSWGTGDSDMLEYAPICDQVLRVSNLAELTSAIDVLLA
jgi:uncharacterized protein with von Willebrand factor type A (vWA) domain